MPPSRAPPRVEYHRAIAPPAAPPPRSRFAPLTASLTLAFAALFVDLLTASARAYSGGTFCDAHTKGFSIAANYVCDLSHPEALNGADNSRSVLLIKGAFVCLALAMGAFWLLHGVWVRRFGLPSAACAVFVPLTPSTVSSNLHAVAVLGACLPGLVAAYLAWRVAQKESPELSAASSLSLITAFAAVGLYVRILVHNDPCAVALPVMQKVAALALLGWMLVRARAVLLQRRGT